VNLNQKFILDLKKGLEHISNINGLNSDNKIMEDLGDEFYIQKLINNCMIQKKEINHENDNIENNEIEDEEKEDEEIESEEENNEQLINSMTENIYAKIEEKSNNIYIFNYYSNKLKKYFAISRNNKDFMFNSNCYSLYDKDNNCIYVSGGLIDVNDQNSHDNSLYKININLIKYNKNENKENKNIINYIAENNKNNKINYENIIESLCPMNNNRSYHSMLQLSSNKNIILCIGGINTESCEVYNIELNSWVSIQDLPIICQNPTIVEHNRIIYTFPYSNEFNTIYKLNMNNNDFIWETIKYVIHVGKIRKGMAAITIENNIYLLGGYDNEDIYSDAYSVDLEHDDYIEIKSSANLNLPKKCFFNSNYIIINNINKNNIINNENNDGNPNETILLMDNNNGIIEFDQSLGKYNYFEG
jgi:hypothetical protein